MSADLNWLCIHGSAVVELPFFHIPILANSLNVTLTLTNAI